MDYRIILLACFGAFLQELIHWHGIRRKLEIKRYKKEMRSFGYWVLTVAMIIASGFGTYFWYEQAINLHSFQYIVTGAAFPLLFKKIVQLFIDNKPQLGESDDNNFASNIKTYFEAS